MSVSERTAITAEPRAERGSRAVRRLRKEGQVPGVLYGHKREPVVFKTSEREFRAALKQGHQLFDLAFGGDSIPVMVKDQQHHPVRGGFTHIDLVEVNLKEKVQAPVPVELHGVEESPGVVEGGVLEQVARELTIEALPTEIPDSLHIDVSTLVMNATLTLADAKVTPAVTIIEDEDTVIASITPPSKVEEPVVEEEIEVTEQDEEAAEDSGAEASDAEASDEADASGQ